MDMWNCPRRPREIDPELSVIPFFLISFTNAEFNVSRLVILHEEAEDGNAMPDLTRPVSLVSRAVDNLIKVMIREIVLSY
ncbi:unnamed protein product [Strongylus vulgaris]|uniref:Uncharacterized protein n=1 Tax=Strongylus vulgaris TaxID=40348 RepID=A0A3P7IT50_STRVU|nr:unnamed protein product [Strongylus vulgaris]